MRNTALTIHAVTPGSPAANAGVAAGSTLLSLNGRAVTDALGLRFAETAEKIVLVWRDGEGRERRAAIGKPDDVPLGLDVDPLKMHACNNKCTFCFAHQNARGMRRALYFKDDDYRFSFLNGNFATLTNLTDADMARIVAERLSPLYISVHTTDWSLRNRILGNPNAPNVLEQIGRFAAARIAMHTQVVLCPGVNDGAHLAKTLEDLQPFSPSVATVALVPVGLTQYRERLPVLRTPDGTYARELLTWVEPRRRRCLRTLGTRFAFPSDEFYLLAGRSFPSARSYEGYAQLGNGVGGSRKFLEEFRRCGARLPSTVHPRRRVSIVTGMLAVPVLSPVVERLNGVQGLDVRLVPVRNAFFGGSVTCAGLLTGTDILQTLEREADNLGDEILIPSICLKDDEDVFLDDRRLADVGVQCGRPVVRVDTSARSLVRAVLSGSPPGASTPPAVS
jgi:putative radical SAM enzyme (TIGR03279 family)